MYMSVVDEGDEEVAAVEKPTTLASIESLTFPLVQQVVILADFRCKRCQAKVAEILSRLNGDEESVEVSLLEKKVTLTLTRRVVYKKPMSGFAHIRRLFLPTRG